LSLNLDGSLGSHHIVQLTVCSGTFSPSKLPLNRTDFFGGRFV
jgi:hypothetical protein